MGGLQRNDEGSARQLDGFKPEMAAGLVAGGFWLLPLRLAKRGQARSVPCGFRADLVCFRRGFSRVRQHAAKLVAVEHSVDVGDDRRGGCVPVAVNAA